MTSPASRPASPLVVARQLSRTFGDGTRAVVAIYDASCTIGRGELVALSGPSGSGKSTLTHLLAGLDTPTSGTIEWPELGRREDLRPGPVAVVFQAPSLLPPLTVVENVELPLLLQGATRPTAHNAALEALDRLHLTDLSGKFPEELSGGQAQRVAVARVLAGRPSLILADEPTGQLDQDNAILVVDALVMAATHLDAGLLINTHDPAVSARLPQQWRMRDGRLVASGATHAERHTVPSAEEIEGR